MKATCQNCGIIYDINVGKITKAKVKFKCRQCQKYVYVYSENINSRSNLKGSTKTCSKCGYKLETHAEECPHCITQLEKDKANIGKIQSEDIKSTNDSNSKKSDKKDPNTTEEKEKMNPDDVLMFCRACWKLISTDVENCPHCGESYKR